MGDSVYKLKDTGSTTAFKYSYLLGKIFPYLRPYLFRIFLGFLVAIPLGLLDGVTAFALKPYLDYVVGGKNLEFSIYGNGYVITSIQMAFLLPLGVVLFAGFQGILRYLNDYISAWTSQRITNDVKISLFQRLISMHPQFFDENPSGIVISRYMTDPVSAATGIVDQIKTITTSVFGALGLIAVMLYSSWKLAIIGVVVLCVAFIPVALIRKRIKKTSNRNMVIDGNLTTNINETYSGNKVMAAYGLQSRQEKLFVEQIHESFRVNMSLIKRSAWMSPLMYLIASFGIAMVLGVGTFLINSGQMTAGSFASFVTSLLLLYKPVKTLGNTLTRIQNIFVALSRVFELFDLKPIVVDVKNPKHLSGLNSGITFENVNFAYVDDNYVLKNFNLSVSKNETIAIVGNSGGGKSTLVNLLPRFYDINSGAIKIDGIDIREFSLSSLRDNISMVFQDNFLFSGSIRENILMGKPDATEAELSMAVESAHLQDLINELPNGIDTELGERGLTLSGGQRQRIAIARAMLRNAPIVILDEATSALDNESEAIVQKAMDNLMTDRTVFIIAHRLSTIKNADRIAVINEGKLVELGSHNELLSIADGHYKMLYEMQFKNDENEVCV
ncbi:ABC transporter ATP-binding protein [bacterium]|nr:ABC transporter ATP-binding protein [bacterium]